jgi:hypothetical protein
VKVSLLAAVGALALLFVVPALADDAPSVAACKAEYQQLGQAGFAAKYGAGEAGYKACVQAHGGTVPTPPPTNGDSGPVAACKAEYQQLGPAGFAAKYGAGDAGGRACVQAHGGTPPPPPTQGGGDHKPKPSPDTANAATYVAQALCAAEAKSLGKDGFQSKYGTGKDGLSACVHAQAPRAQSILAACKASAGSSADAFKQCVYAAVKPGAR